MRSKGTLITGAIIAAVLAGIVLAQSYDPGTELTLIERVYKARDEYKTALTELRNFYLRTGDAANGDRAKNELKALSSIEQYEYAAGTVGASVEGPAKVLRSIAEADDYYTDAEIFAGSNRKAQRDIALRRFEKILTTWPDSDKAAPASYMMGDIYSGLYYRDYDLAAKYYRKAYELDPATSLPALLKAGDMLYKLERYKDAVEVYKLAAKGSRDPRTRDKAQGMLDKLAKKGY